MSHFYCSSNSFNSLILIDNEKKKDYFIYKNIGFNIDSVSYDESILSDLELNYLHR